jgi:DNA-binding NarL/FixJ family response regulator
MDPQIQVVFEAETGNEVLEYIRASPVDVVILDITMPGRNGLETLKELKRLAPQIAVVVLSMHPLEQYALRVLKAGAAGYISKESAPEELVDAIRRAYRGDRHISPAVAALLADFVERRPSDHPHELLSDREFEVLKMIASGKGITQIADELNLSVKTVSTYKSRIVEKTGLSSTAEITRYALEHGLI